MIPRALSEAFEHDGENREEAAVILGLLIERAEWSRRGIEPDGTLEEILGDPELAAGLVRQVTPEEASNLLAAHVQESPNPEPAAVWALTKSADTRMIDVLADVVDRFARDAEMEHLVYQAVVGLARSDEPAARTSLEAVARLGHNRAHALAKREVERRYR